MYYVCFRCMKIVVVLKGHFVSLISTKGEGGGERERVGGGGIVNTPFLQLISSFPNPDRNRNWCWPLLSTVHHTFCNWFVMAKDQFWEENKGWISKNNGFRVDHTPRYRKVNKLEKKVGNDKSCKIWIEPDGIVDAC